MYIITPYINPTKLLQTEGVKVSRIDTDIEYNDSINTIILVENNKAIRFIELSRKLGGTSLLSNYSI